MAASSGFLLGADYSEWLPAYVTQIATDSSGALYILSALHANRNLLPYPCVTKTVGGREDNPVAEQSWIHGRIPGGIAGAHGSGSQRRRIPDTHFETPAMRPSLSPS